MNRTFAHSGKQAISLAALSAILAVLSFPPCSFSPLAWISLVPWLYSLSQQSVKQMLLSHAVFLCLFFGIGLSWMAAVHPLCPIVILFPLYFICLPFPLLFRWAIVERRLCPFILAPVLWSAGEYLRSFLFSGFPYLFLGHTQAFHPWVIQIADITGVYGVTFLIVMVNALLVVWLRWYLDRSFVPFRRIVAYTGVSALSLVLVLAYGNHRLKTISYEMGPKVASIQGNIPQDIKDDPAVNIQRILESYTKLTQEALLEKPDLLIWPETMSPGDLQHEGRPWTMFRKISRENKLHLLIGSHFYDCDFTARRYKTYNSACFLTPEGKVVERYDKIRLVVIGEFIPLRNVMPFLPEIVRNIAGFVPDLAEGKRRPVFTLGKHRFGALICYDIAYSEDARELAQKGCDFLVNLTNEGWFENTCELEMLLASSIFRAVENRIGILRSANTGITLTIPPTGVLDRKDILAIPVDLYFSSLPSYLKKRIAQTYLFSLPGEEGQKMDILRLQRLFKEKGYLLSERTVIDGKTKSEWVVMDPERNDLYYLVKESPQEGNPSPDIHVFRPGYTLAWHHLSYPWWQKDVDFFTRLDRNWDVMFNGEKLKWKDFPGILCRHVPLKEEKKSFYTRFGNLFAWLLASVSLVLVIGFASDSWHQKWAKKIVPA